MTRRITLPVKKLHISCNTKCDCFRSDGLFPVILPQRIRATVNTQEQKRLLMDLDISMRTVDCFYTVTFYGALFREVASQKRCSLFIFFVRSWRRVFLGRGVKESILKYSVVQKH